LAVVTPNRPDDGRTSGRADIGRLNREHISSLHRMFWMSNKRVRLALVVSVMCTPPVSFQTSHESMVPNAKCSSLSTLPSVSSHSNFEPEK
jgi:hypothetical protein